VCWLFPPLNALDTMRGSHYAICPNHAQDWKTHPSSHLHLPIRSSGSVQSCICPKQFDQSLCCREERVLRFYLRSCGHCKIIIPVCAESSLIRADRNPLPMLWKNIHLSIDSEKPPPSSTLSRHVQLCNEMR